MKKQSILLRLMAFTKKYSLYWTGALLCAVLSVSLTLLAPVIIGQGVDLIVGAGDVDFSGLLRVLALLGAVILLGAGFQWLLALFTNLLTQRTVRDLRAAAFDKLDRAPLKYIDGNAHGDIISRVVTDIDLISEGLLQGFTQLFTGVITILGTLCFMAGVNVKIAGRGAHHPTVPVCGLLYRQALPQPVQRAVGGAGGDGRFCGGDDRQ